MADLTILHTNDLHGKLPKYSADRIASEKAASDECLLLDAGDAVSSGNIYFRPGGEPILVRLNELGYSAMAMGNREFHFMATGLRSKVRLASFPILSANIRSEKVDIGPSVVPSIRLEVNGIRVAIFGLSVPMITKRMFASKASPFWFEDPVSAAKSIVPALRDQADLVVALTHIGLRTDMELAGAVPGIDLIVGGHTHAILNEPVIVNETSIVQAGSWGRYLGKIEIDITPKGRPTISTGLIGLKSK